jgi:hypothetical protein
MASSSSASQIHSRSSHIDTPNITKTITETAFGNVKIITDIS